MTDRKIVQKIVLKKSQKRPKMHREFLLIFVFTMLIFFSQVHSEAGVGEEEEGVGGSRGLARVGETDSEASRRVCVSDSSNGVNSGGHMLVLV